MCVGILVGHFLVFSFVFCCVTSISFLFFWRCANRQRAPIGSAGTLLLLAITFSAAAWHNVSWRMFEPNHVALRVLQTERHEKIAMRCRLATVAEVRGLTEVEPLATIPQSVRTSFEVDVLEVRDRMRWIPASGRIDVRVSGHVLGRNVGDVLEIFGTLALPDRPMNPGQRDRRADARAERLLGQLDVSYPDCIRLVKPTRLGLAGAIGQMRSAGLRILDQYVGQPRDVLAGALLLGARDRMEPDRVDAFFHTGTIHLLAISGLHVGILAWGFFVLAKSSQARTLILLTLMCGAVLYCSLTGARAPVLRAVILIQVLCVGLIWRRNIVAYNALAAAAIAVLIYRPAELFRPGAQLSFLAVATLIWLSLNVQPKEQQPLERLVERTRPWYQKLLRSVWLNTRRLGLAGFAIWLVTLPLVMQQFHLLAPSSLLLNVVLSVPIAISLLSGFGVLLLGNIFEPAARLLGAISDQSLAFVESTVQLVHEIPGTYFWTAGPHPVWVSVFYVGVVILAFVPQCRPTRYWAVAWVLLWLAVPTGWELAADLTQPPTDTELRCTFLSVGHGTCVVLELPDDRVLLYDCGRMGLPQTGVQMVSEFLWHRGISHIDGIVVSHADADHYNIVPGLLDRFSVGEVFAASFMFDSDAPGIRVLKQAIETSRIPIVHLSANDVIRFGETSMTVLHPLSTGVHGSDNANSIVLDVQHQGSSILLPGDLEALGLQHVMAELPRDTDMLMAAHHGSLRSSPQEFAAWCTPEFIVISGGKKDDDEAAARVFDSIESAELFHTARDGAITVLIEDGEIRVEAFVQR